MNWLPLESRDQLDEILLKSKENTQLIFKHSTRCSISLMVKDRLDRSVLPENITCYYLDLLAHRELSNLIADTFSIQHESPQILLIKNGMCTYHESHGGIRPNEIMANA
jgi:bacillithiol system protein YtxJ